MKLIIGRRCMFQCNDDDLIKWYDGYQKYKEQKASIKEQLMPITWHPSRWWDWCIPNDEKKKRGRKILVVTDSCFQDYLIRKRARNDQTF